MSPYADPQEIASISGGEAFQGASASLLSGWSTVSPKVSETNTTVSSYPKAAKPRWIVDSIQRLRALLGLKEDWNSYGANPIDRQAVEVAASFMAKTLKPDTTSPFIAPLSSGGIQIEWHQAGLDVEIAFDPGVPTPEFYIHDRNSGIESESVPSDQDLAEIIDQLS